MKNAAILAALGLVAVAAPGLVGVAALGLVGVAALAADAPVVPRSTPKARCWARSSSRCSPPTGSR